MNNDDFAGFSSAQELIGYCEIHCKTPRALFSGRQIKAILRVSGMKCVDQLTIKDDEFESMHEEMEEIVWLARENIAQGEHNE